MEKLEGWKRSHTCGELTAKQSEAEVILMGCVHRRRDHGKLIFIDLRDRYGLTQIVFDPDVIHDHYQKAKDLRGEFVIAVTGKVRLRPAGMINPNLATGEIEVLAKQIKVLNPAKTPPFGVDEVSQATEETRLRYRYIDLRGTKMKNNLLLRHKTYELVRSFFNRNNFVEIETPILMRSTPEGARDYLVPSRVSKGKFYALPQSPQTYKQILMVAGMDRYYQIVRCFRDEDLRADRQPEFTQIDVEMSFVEREQVLCMVEGLMADIFQKILGRKLETPVPRFTYAQAIKSYGSDKPDLRFDMKIVTLNGVLVDTGFKVFADCLKNGGTVCGILAQGCARYSRKQIDLLTEAVKQEGAKGLVAIKVDATGWSSPLTKFFSAEEIRSINAAFDAEAGDLILIVADAPETALRVTGSLRLKVAQQEDLIPEDVFKLVWILDFPLLEYDDEEGRYVARHHPFTSPRDEDLPELEQRPEQALAKAYDLVLNGYEIAGGSIRIHNRDLQDRIFRLLGISEEQARDKFGFLLDAFEFGAPPHGGIAFGFDRMVMILANETSIRNVIAFPKTNSALSLMDGAPSEVSERQLTELGLRLDKPKNENAASNPISNTPTPE